MTIHCVWPSSLCVTFFGIKNASSRSGFEVRVPASMGRQVDPVACLRHLARTASHVEDAGKGPMFIQLRSLFAGVQAATIGDILSEAIVVPGLGGQGYSPWSFPPMGTSAAIKADTKPETAMEVGRWKYDQVFHQKYAYPLVQDSVLQFSGVGY